MHFFVASFSSLVFTSDFACAVGFNAVDSLVYIPNLICNYIILSGRTLQKREIITTSINLAFYQIITKDSSDYFKSEKRISINSKIGTSISQEVKLRDISETSYGRPILRCI